MAAATMWVSCDRAPDAVTIAVFGGLASTANAPISPAAMLPAPMPTKSRLKSMVADVLALDARTVAAVYAMQTNATVNAAGSSCHSCDQDAKGSRKCGKPSWNAPSTATP